MPEATQPLTPSLTVPSHHRSRNGELAGGKEALYSSEYSLTSALCAGGVRPLRLLCLNAGDSRVRASTNRCVPSNCRRPGADGGPVPGGGPVPTAARCRWRPGADGGPVPMAARCQAVAQCPPARERRQKPMRRCRCGYTELYMHTYIRSYVGFGHRITCSSCRTWWPCSSASTLAPACCSSLPSLARRTPAHRRKENCRNECTVRPPAVAACSVSSDLACCMQREQRFSLLHCSARNGLLRRCVQRCFTPLHRTRVPYSRVLTHR